MIIKMQIQKLFLLIVVVLFLSHCFSSCRALDCTLNERDPYKVAYTIFVDQSGHGNFASIQKAIDSIPVHNTQWIRIQISAGKYVEKVVIPVTKPCIFLEGADVRSTSIEWNDHTLTSTSYTFGIFAENVVAKRITFRNTYNVPRESANPEITQAVALLVNNDKAAFYFCAFIGLQDTLFDNKGRHYFHKCYVRGATDFIFGSGQSIYEKSFIEVNVGEYAKGYGVITAHRRETAEEPGAFVFKNCKIGGTVKTYLGRPWRPYARVIFYSSILPDTVLPGGWDSGNFPTQVQETTFVESKCSGPGADTSKRVKWEKKLSDSELNKFVDISFINQDGWLNKLPKVL